MPYYSTNNKLVGRYIITRHAFKRYKERYGDRYIGGKKIKNMSKPKAQSKIIKSLKYKSKKIMEQNDGYLKVITKDFQAVVKPENKNVIVTII